MEINLSISWEEIQSASIDRIVSVVDKLKVSQPFQYRQRLSVSLDGVPDNSLHECWGTDRTLRCFARAWLKECPYLFYFLDPAHPSAYQLATCLTEEILVLIDQIEVPHSAVEESAVDLAEEATLFARKIGDTEFSFSSAYLALARAKSR